MYYAIVFLPLLGAIIAAQVERSKATAVEIVKVRSGQGLP